MPGKKSAKRSATERREGPASPVLRKLEEKPCLRPEDVRFVDHPSLEITVGDLIQVNCFRDLRSAQFLTSRILHDISSALCRLQSVNPPLVLNTIRPSCIHYKDKTFILADPVSQTEPISNTDTETWTDAVYSPPEPLDSDSSIPGPKADIYALGMTAVACLSSMSDVQIQSLCNGDLGA